MAGKETQNGKRFSIIVPARNEEGNIQDLLRSLLQIEYPLESVEVIVIDDLSQDDTSGAVTRFIQGNNILEIKLVRASTRMGPGGARNLGARLSAGDIIAFVDSDDIIPKDWLTRTENFFRRFPEISGVTGPAIPVENREDSVVARYEGLRRWYYETLEEGIVKSGKLFRGGNMAILRHVFLSLGGFNEKLFTKEDHEFGQRFLENGYKAYYSRDVLVYHKWQKSLSAMLIRQFNSARGEASVFRKYRNLVPKDLVVFAAALVIFFASLLVIGVFNTKLMLSIGLIAFICYCVLVWIHMRKELRFLRVFDRILIPVYSMVNNIAWSAGFLFETSASVLKRLTSKVTH
jgi:glycosyltransferase involved in cell wall biosynthesis